MIKTVTAIVVLAGLGLGVGRMLRGGTAAHDEVTTVVVHKEKFVRRVVAEGNLRAVKATPVAAPSSQGDFGALKIAWLAPDGTMVKKGDVLVKFDPSEPQKALRDGEADRAAADAKLASERIKSKAAVADSEQDAQLASEELDKTRKLQSKDEMIFSRNQIIESQIDENLANARQDHAEKAKAIKGHQSQSNAAVINVERQKADLAIHHANKALDAMQIVAPHDGIFVLKRSWRGEQPKLGDQLWPGQPVGEIPLLEKMEAEVFVLEIDGSGLAEKQPAELVIEAHPETKYTGKIRLVDKLAKPRQMGSPVQYFAVVIELDNTVVEVMKPGQRVRATLVLDQEDAIVVPRQAVIDKDNKNVVFKRGATGFTPVPVELGPATAGRVVIKSGLADGDEITLRDPTRTEAAGSGSAGSGK
jgi:HlyD family secretion protein